MAHIWCILVILCFASCVAEKTEAEQGFKDLQLHQDSLAWLDKLQDKQESTTRHSLLELLYKLSKFENGSIFKGATDTEKQKKNRRGLAMTTRRSSCKVFFWKTWTAC